MQSIDHLVERVQGHRPRTLKFDFPEAGILVPVIKSDSGPALILTQRTQDMSTHAGQVAFPGGKRDEGDQDLLDTALRETEEEIGLCRDQVEIVGPLSQVVSRYGILVTPYVGLVEPDAGLTRNEQELDAIFNVPVRFFLDTRPSRHDLLKFRQFSLHVPCYHYENYEIWGMSAIVIAEFLNVVCDAGIDLLKEPK